LLPREPSNRLGTMTRSSGARWEKLSTGCIMGIFLICG
jgi:hypothetical protein